MANQYNNKVVLSNGTTLIDLSTDTVTDASHIMSGKVGHLADGSVVTGTGASESQVVSIEDVPNTTGTTAVITGVAAPEGSISITTNGTHDVYNYETAVVAVPSIDVPTFSSSDGVTITCDKTYAQCLAILNGGENRAFISFAGSNPDSLAGVNDLGVLKYYYVYNGALNARIQYSSNGSITISSVDTGQTLNVTSNGTYTQSDDNAWARVNVNVPTGSATIQPLTVTANGVYTAPSGVDGYSPVTVNVSGGGGGGNEDDPIRFFDYDGTLVASYTSVPASLPSVPTHSRLTNGTWNYTLAKIEAQFNATGTCDIGANYDTASGKTEIDIVLDDPDYLSPYLAISPYDTVTIDWGDGSGTDNMTGSSSYASPECLQHIYASTGSYTITIDGRFGFYAASISNGAVLSGDPVMNKRRTYTQCVTSVLVGANARIGNYSFSGCCSLKSVAISSSVTSTIGSYAFYTCRPLVGVAIPNGVTTISSSAFSNCYSLKSITVPSGVTSIGAAAFYSCYSVLAYHFLPTTPPTLANTNAFSSIVDGSIIYVPQGSLEAYQTATNWSTYASYMVEEA